MPALFEYSHTVTPEEIDGQGHAGNVVYVDWMQQAAVAHSAAQGWPPQRYQQSEAGWVVRTHEIEYLQPAWENDRIVVQTWVADFKKLTSLRRYRIIRSEPANDPCEPVETVLATAATNWVYIGFELRMPRRIPVELSGAFEILDDDLVPGSITSDGRP